MPRFRSVSLAMKAGVRVQVLSSFIDDDATPADQIPGTMIVSDEEMEGIAMERQLVTGIAADKNEAKIILTRVPDRPGAVAADTAIGSGDTLAPKRIPRAPPSAAA